MLQSLEQDRSSSDTILYSVIALQDLDEHNQRWNAHDSVLHAVSEFPCQNVQTGHELHRQDSMFPSLPGMTCIASSEQDHFALHAVSGIPSLSS